jgi:hypothetical protein
MKATRWQRNFDRAVVVDLYVKPILAAMATLVVVVLVVRWLFPSVVDPTMAILAVLLYYACFLDAKIDMLKRTVDDRARFRETRKLWVEGDLP